MSRWILLCIGIGSLIYPPFARADDKESIALGKKALETRAFNAAPWTVEASFFDGKLTQRRKDKDATSGTASRKSDQRPKEPPRNSESQRTCLAPSILGDFALLREPLPLLRRLPPFQGHNRQNPYNRKIFSSPSVGLSKLLIGRYRAIFE